MDPSIAQSVEAIDEPDELWTRLYVMYDEVSKARGVEINSALEKMEYDGKESITRFVHQFLGLRASLELLDNPNANAHNCVEKLFRAFERHDKAVFHRLKMAVQDKPMDSGKWTEDHLVQGLNFLFSLQETRDAGDRKDRSGHINLIESDGRRGESKKGKGKKNESWSKPGNKRGNNDNSDKGARKREKLSCKFCSGDHSSSDCKKCGNWGQLPGGVEGRGVGVSELAAAEETEEAGGEGGCEDKGLRIDGVQGGDQPGEDGDQGKGKVRNMYGGREAFIMVEGGDGRQVLLDGFGVIARGEVTGPGAEGELASREGAAVFIDEAGGAAESDKLPLGGAVRAARSHNFVPSYTDHSMVEFTIGYDDAFQSEVDQHAKGHELRAFAKTSEDFIRLQREDPDFAGRSP
ncbi:hypothetical protein HDU67_000426, partial [Dinochytrium kinnereticum]